MRVGVVPQFVFGCALVELCSLHQVLKLAEVVPPAFTNATRDAERLDVAGELFIVDELKSAGEEVEGVIMTSGRIEFWVFARQECFLTAEDLPCLDDVRHTIAEAKGLFAQLTKHSP